MVLDDVIVISDDEGPSQPRRFKRHRPGSSGGDLPHARCALRLCSSNALITMPSAGTPAKPSAMIDVYELSNVVNIMDDDSDVEFVDADPPQGMHSC